MSKAISKKKARPSVSKIARVKSRFKPLGTKKSARKKVMIRKKQLGPAKKRKHANRQAGAARFNRVEYNRGYDKGYDEGYDQGFSQGYYEGSEKGQEDNYKID